MKQCSLKLESRKEPNSKKSCKDKNRLIKIKFLSLSIGVIEERTLFVLSGLMKIDRGGAPLSSRPKQM